MSTSKEVVAASEDILARVRELSSPKDAVCAILVAHVKLTLDHGLQEKFTLDQALARYVAAFKESYSG